MKAIITVVGKDTIGIVSAVSVEITKLKINILDINQTIMNNNFTMMMMVDLSKSPNKFEEIRTIFDELSIDLGVNIRIQREEIFNSMHTL
ncbi:MAG: ACT domain-containing protein [Clostridium sp.]|uniref:ACT domain-containing protein n=1 Tax=Clostridium sp. TaxID=1506 RepID=UPI003F3DC7AC